MRIALFTGFGSSDYPSFLKNQLPGTSFVEDRAKLASILDALEPTHDESSYTVYRDFKAGRLSLDYIKFANPPNTVYVKDTEDNYVFPITIRNVDTNRRWKLDNYDGAESISYFEEPEMVDEEYNFCR